ncbi:MAG: hypothetical protein FWC27_15805 [Firmicutes bacterium]|nr:hypothetical protein [Bacillota bacterium]
MASYSASNAKSICACAQIMYCWPSVSMPPHSFIRWPVSAPPRQYSRSMSS